MNTHITIICRYELHCDLRLPQYLRWLLPHHVGDVRSNTTLAACLHVVLGLCCMVCRGFCYVQEKYLCCTVNARVFWNSPPGSIILCCTTSTLIPCVESLQSPVCCQQMVPRTHNAGMNGRNDSWFRLEDQDNTNQVIFLWAQYISLFLVSQ